MDPDTLPFAHRDPGNPIFVESPDPYQRQSVSGSGAKPNLRPLSGSMDPKAEPHTADGITGVDSYPGRTS